MVSCIIPTHNRKTMLPDAIESVLGQSLRPMEIVVVDDGSVDGTSRMVKEKYPFVKLIKSQRIGPGPARNAGVEASCGEVIMFLDSDDTWMPNHVDALVNVVNEGVDVAYGITKTRDHVNNTSFMIPEKGKGPSGDCFKKMARWCFLVPSSVAITRKAFNCIGGFHKYEIGEDWDLFIRLAEKYEFGFTSEVISNRVLHTGSLCCKKGIHKSIYDLLENIEKVLSSISKTTQDVYHFIDAARIVVTNEGEKWQTFQEFYKALSRQGLV